MKHKDKRNKQQQQQQHLDRNRNKNKSMLHWKLIRIIFHPCLCPTKQLIIKFHQLYEPNPKPKDKNRQTTKQTIK